MKRIALWFLFGLALSLIPLAVTALREWDGHGNYFDLLINAELLAVGFALAGASGADAITSSPPYQAGKVFLGGLAIVCAIGLASVYYTFSGKPDLHLPADVIKTIERDLFVLAIVLAFLSEIVAD